VATPETTQGVSGRGEGRPQGIRLVSRTLRLPQGVYPRPRYHDRTVMRPPVCVRVQGP
jgi:hypothetical protein